MTTHASNMCFISMCFPPLGIPHLVGFWHRLHYTKFSIFFPILMKIFIVCVFGIESHWNIERTKWVYMMWTKSDLRYKNCFLFSKIVWFFFVSVVFVLFTFVYYHDAYNNILFNVVHCIPWNRSQKQKRKIHLSKIISNTNAI